MCVYGTIYEGKNIIGSQTEYEPPRVMQMTPSVAGWCGEGNAPIFCWNGMNDLPCTHGSHAIV